MGFALAGKGGQTALAGEPLSSWLTCGHTRRFFEEIQLT